VRTRKNPRKIFIRFSEPEYGRGFLLAEQSSSERIPLREGGTALLQEQPKGCEMDVVLGWPVHCTTLNVCRRKCRLRMDQLRSLSMPFALFPPFRVSYGPSPVYFRQANARNLPG